MDKGQAFEMIEQAKVRLLTDEECLELGEWAGAGRAEAIAAGANFASSSLVEGVVEAT